MGCINAKEITTKLDKIFYEYSLFPGFSHPICPSQSPRKCYWGLKMRDGSYRWHLRYETENTGDTSGILIKFYPWKVKRFQFIAGKEREPVSLDEKTSDFFYLTYLFEKSIKENIIGARPKLLI